MTVLAVIGAGFLQAMLFGIVLPRVQGITFALVTLGFAAVFDIMIKSRELAERRTPNVARAWNYRMNMGLDSFRGMFEKHNDAQQ